MKNRLLVSAIITTHNRCELLKRAVRSVEKQTYNNIEIIVVDDASTDNTREYGESLIQKGFKYIYIPQSDSKGGNYARNIGIMNATGDYVAFLDDDDYWLPEKTALQMAFLRNHPDIEMVYSGFIVDYGKRFFNYKKIPNTFYQGDLQAKKAFCYPFCCTITLIISRSLLNQVGGFDESLHYWQEYELALRILQKTEIGLVEKPLAVATRNLNDQHRLTNQFDQWIAAVEYINKKHETLFYELSPGQLAQKEEYFNKEAAYRASVVKKKKEMKYYYMKAFKISKKPEYLVRALLGVSKQSTLFIETLIMKVAYYIKRIMK